MSLSSRKLPWFVIRMLPAKTKVWNSLPTVLWQNIAIILSKMNDFSSMAILFATSNAHYKLMKTLQFKCTVCNAVLERIPPQCDICHRHHGCEGCMASGHNCPSECKAPNDTYSYNMCRCCAVERTCSFCSRVICPSCEFWPVLDINFDGQSIEMPQCGITCRSCAFQ